MWKKRIKKGIVIIAVFSSMRCFAGSINVTVVYNNVEYDKNLTTAWGLSCVIQGMEKTILFDTGGDGAILINNMKKLKIDPTSIDVVVLSHIHADHTDGIWDFLRVNNKVTVYILSSFPQNIKKNIGMLCSDVKKVDKPVKICDCVFSTGELGTFLKEQSLVIVMENGLVIITGCAHPGIVEIAAFAKDHFKRDIYLILGGFHLMAYNDMQIETLIRKLKELGVKKVGPSHCTGGRAIELFRHNWGKDFFDLGCGAKLTISEK